MKINDQLIMFPIPELRHALTNSPLEVDVSETEFVKNLKKQPFDQQEKLFTLYVEALEKHKKGDYAKTAKRLFNRFRDGTEKRERSEAVNKLVERVNEVFNPLKVIDHGKFPQHLMKLSEHHLIGKDVAKALDIESDIADHATSDPLMIVRKKERDIRHEAGFSYDVMDVHNVRKVVVCGIARSDKSDCLNQFYGMLIKERVKVLLALNMPWDWDKAIPYYEAAQLAQCTFEGWHAHCESTELIFEVPLASYIPSFAKDTVPRDIDMRSDKVRMFRPRIVQRNLVFERGTERHITHQLHYENWPDRQHPPSLTALELLFKRRTDLTQGIDTIGVHCQGGIGRTMFVAALDEIFERINKLQVEKGLGLSDAEINIPEIMYHMKLQAPRLGGEPNAARFAELYQVVGEYYNTCMRQASHGSASI